MQRRSLIGGLAIVAPLLALPGRAEATATLDTEVERFGILRWDVNQGKWIILDTPTHKNRGLTGVECSSGNLVINYDHIDAVGTFYFVADETFVGMIFGGVSAGLDYSVVKFRRPGISTYVSCTDPIFHNSSGNFQFSIKGWV